MWRGLKCRVQAPLDCLLLSFWWCGFVLSPPLMLKKKTKKTKTTQMEWLLLLVHIITSLQTKNKNPLLPRSLYKNRFVLFMSPFALLQIYFLFISRYKKFFLSSLFNLLAQQLNKTKPQRITEGLCELG
ncbi:DNA-directed RNA polymerase II subunit RPB3 [Platysternon megacephalum]|uniref:DNA-directed RNA polymerase II subunit RPB3 n=1 Tax=Platysternon megacephalum TaxID=55544 RepID=A0A4D9E032_9SAUR|nr:DNA-directed RNA polymerase II subunit RPB3 [Platysternon megacephalum]